MKKFLELFAPLCRWMDGRVNHQELERFYLKENAGESALAWHGLMGLLGLLSVAILVMGIGIRVMAAYSPPVPVLAYADSSLRVSRNLKNFNTPFYSSVVVQRWAYNALVTVFTQDFLNYKKQEDAYRVLFTAEGYKSFNGDDYNGAFSRSHIFQSMRHSNLRIAAVPMDQPRIASIKSYKGGKLLVWDVFVPVLIVYQGAINSKAPLSEKAMINMIIVSVDPSVNPEGLGLESITLQAYSE